MDKFILWRTRGHLLLLYSVHDGQVVKITVSCKNELLAHFYFFSELIIHPDYNPDERENDFGILKLATPVTFSDSVSPICLPSATTNYDNNMATVAGWGITEWVAGAQNSDILQKVRIDV